MGELLKRIGEYWISGFITEEQFPIELLTKLIIIEESNREIRRNFWSILKPNSLDLCSVVEEIFKGMEKTT